MADKKKKDDNINNLLIVGGVIIFIALFGVIMYRATFEKKPEVTTVKFGDSDNQVEVNRNGDVTIKTPFGVYKQKWDKTKLDNFFKKFDDLDFEGLGEYVGQGLAIELTFGDGTDLKIEYSDDLADITDELQEELEEIYNEEDEEVNFGDGDTDYFFESNKDKGYDIEVDRKIYDESEEENDNTNDGEEEEDGDPWTGSAVEDAKEIECKQVDPRTGKIVIISNTVCGR